MCTFTLASFKSKCTWLMVDAGMPWNGVPPSALVVTLTYAWLNAGQNMKHFLKSEIWNFGTAEVWMFGLYYSQEYVRFWNWRSDNFSGTGVTTRLTREQCTNNIPNIFTVFEDMNYLRFQIFLVNLFTFCLL